MSFRKHSTTVNLPVELTFEVLPAMEVDGHALPPMLDILKVSLTVVGPSGSPRTIDITKTFSEAEIIMLEDDIIENYEE